MAITTTTRRRLSKRRCNLGTASASRLSAASWLLLSLTVAVLVLLSNGNTASLVVMGRVGESEYDKYEVHNRNNARDVDSGDGVGAVLNENTDGNDEMTSRKQDDGIATEIGRASCDEPEFSTMGFCDSSLDITERVHDLISRLTLKEKIGLVSASPDHESCPLTDEGVPRLGISRYTYLVEVNTAVASRCLDGPAGKEKCSTTFASPALLASTFNRTVWYHKGHVISEEMRAYYHTESKRGNQGQSPIGLHGYAPNVNIVRDPRWGRNDEVPSEDPFLAGEYAKHFTQGMQQRDAQGYLKMHASMKHFTAYSVETHRESFNGEIDTFNLHDTYLPAFEKGIREGKSGGAMCSYASINGIPSCANAWLFEKARRDWNQSNFLISTDCGAINHMQQKGGNHYATNVTDAIVKTLKAGTDLEMGDTMYQTDNNMQHAIEDAHLASEDDVDQALKRILYHRFDLGMFDSLAQQEYAQRDHVSIINATEHQEFNLEAATQGFVLLQNPNDMLPLKFQSKAGVQQNRKVAVVGPHAMSRKGLFEGYYGDAVCQGGGFECVPTIGEEIAKVNNAAGGSTTILASDSMQQIPPSTIKQAVRLARDSDVIIVCVGLDQTLEREGLDRPNDDIRLESTQLALVNALRRVSSNVVVVLINGGALAIEDLLDSDYRDSESHGNIINSSDDHTPAGKLSSAAIVEAFYPGFKGAEALAKTLFNVGDNSNRWGLLPLSIYSNEYTQELDMNDMSFTKAPGRTYRYYTGKNVLFPFGYGLSYTTFEITRCTLTAPVKDEDVTINCNIQNSGKMAGDAIVLLFHRIVTENGASKNISHPIPLKSLGDFSRHTLEPEEDIDVAFTLTLKDMSVTGETGEKMFYDHLPHEFTISTHGDGVAWTLQYDPSRDSLLSLSSTSAITGNKQ